MPFCYIFMSYTRKRMLFRDFSMPMNHGNGLELRIMNQEQEMHAEEYK
mgnify:CR=1 FL=1